MLSYLQLIEDHEEKCKFERLYHKYHRLMYAAAKSILKSDYDAGDAGLLFEINAYMSKEEMIRIAENISYNFG